MGDAKLCEIILKTILELTQLSYKCVHQDVFMFVPNGSNFVCLVFNNQDLKFEQNPVNDCGDIGCACMLSLCMHMVTAQLPTKNV